MAKKTKHKLNTPAEPLAPYVMPEPNSDVAAYNWELTSLRQPAPDSKDKNDPDRGASIFRTSEETMRTMLRYGHDAQFICPKYLQILLDKSADVRAAADATVKARYSKAAIENLRKVILQVFHKQILPDIIKNVENISVTLAQFYTARAAHVKKFGRE